MSAKQNSFEQALENIADGRPLDSHETWWSEEETHSKPVFRALEVLAQISHYNKSISLETLPSAVPRKNIGNSLIGKQWGDLCVKKKIGEGGFAEVYCARDPALDRDVALKLFPVGSSPIGQAGEAFIEEGRLLARVRHPNVVTVHGAAKRDGLIGIWMTYLKGETLQTWVEKRGVISEQEAVSIGRQMCRALEAVHNQGILHRDVKAQNVMREPDGSCVLMDFGIGLELKGNTEETSLPGTPMYVAPEVFAGEKPTAGSDLYSLGVLLYYMVTGLFPYQRQDLLEAAVSGFQTTKAPCDVLKGKLSKPFIKVLAKALTLDSQKRFKNAGEMLEALNGVQASHHDHRNRLTYSFMGTPGEQPKERRKSLLIGVPLIALLLVLFPMFWEESERLTPWLDLPTTALIVELDSDDGSLAETTKIFSRQLHQNLSFAKQYQLLSLHSSMLAAKNSAFDVQETQKQLQVDHLFWVKIINEGKNLRIVAQSMGELNPDQKAPPESPVEYENFLGNAKSLAKDLFHIASIPDPLLLSMTIQRMQSRVDQAQEHYILGEIAFDTRTKEGLDQARSLFKLALKQDPEFALAHVGLAKVFAISGSVQYGDGSRAKAREKANDHINLALQLEPDLAEAYTVRGFVHFWFSNLWHEAKTDYQTAIRLKPNHALSYQWYADVLMVMGETSAAIKAARKARVLNPLSLPANTALGMQLYFSGQTESAILQLRETLAMPPRRFNRAEICLGACLIELGHVNQAVEVLENVAQRLDQEQPLADLAHAYAISGNTEKATAMLKKMKAMADAGDLNSSPVHQALVLEGLGLEHRKKVQKLFEQAFRERRQFQDWLFIDPRFKNLRKTDWFKSFKSKVGT